MKNQQAISSFKKHINDNTAESHEIRKQIHAAKGLERHRLWNDKRELGRDTRYWLLAYACFRGVPYASVEAKCSEGNAPSPSGLYERILEALPQDAPEKAEWTKDRVKAWLKGETPALAATEAA